ncbi:MAG: response regulator transcription factor [Acidobacteriota bacterium]|nr:response regulator transcription factor [Blastocatellia bacterium]MDW8238790.1 response regulator transcription factor [Acidobacteriota bacterium]
MKRRVLIIEDDPDISRSIQYNLERTGEYDVHVATSGEQGLERLLRHPPDLLVLDVNLPHMSGFEICRRLRRDEATMHIPVVMLTARTAETDKVLGLELGADDYVTKPFSMRELIARIKAIMRRTQPDQPSADFNDGVLHIQFDDFKVTVAGREVKLTRKEFDLLKALVQNQGRVLTRDRLLDRVWGLEYHGATRTLDVHIRRLRQKLGAAGQAIETVVGVGYRFRAQQAAASDEQPYVKAMTS